MVNKGHFSYGIIALSALTYLYLFYFITRPESTELLISYVMLFGGFVYLYNNWQNLKLSHILAVGLIFRLIPLLSVPELSDDFYRFIWDGRMWASGINPFAATPSALMNANGPPPEGLSAELFSLLNSPAHYTVYPPVPQFVNWIAAKLFPLNIFGALLILRLSILIAEVAALFFIVKILGQRQQDTRLVLLYALNPLVIIELSGNLHHEGIMIAFLMGAIYYYKRNRIIHAGVFFAFSVASKLLPLMFLPLLLFKIRNKTAASTAFIITSVILFLPLFDQSFIIGMSDSLSLYYQKFEFNAGLYYLVRELGFWYYDYNAIALIGKSFILVSTIAILGISYSARKIDWPIALALIYLVFCLFSLILHPWYIILLVALMPFTSLQFPLLWSFFIFLTYAGYSQFGFEENYWIVTLEYLMVLIALIYDWRNYTRSNITLKTAP